MFFDFRAAHGAGELLAELRDHIDKRLRLSTPFFVNYAQNALLYKPPLTFFGGIAAESIGGHPRTFNAKDALRPIIGFARLYALQHGVRDTNTLDRLQRLLEKGAIKRALYDDAVGAYDHLMRLRLRQHVAHTGAWIPSANDVDLNALTQLDTTILKQSFHQIVAIQKQLQSDFVGAGANL
jgi:CBS domain-containing protein